MMQAIERPLCPVPARRETDVARITPVRELCSPERFYESVLDCLVDAGAPFLVGGTHALRVYTGIERPTKDLDIFCTQADCPDLLRTLSDGLGVRTEMLNAAWIAKAYCGERYVDIIFSSGNGICDVDADWFVHARNGIVLGRNVPLMAPEEMIWSKAFIQERERYDGADVIHLIHCQQERLNWDYLMWRMEPHWEVLLAHLLNYRFVYPGEPNAIPASVLKTLTERLQSSEAHPETADRLCRGDPLSSAQYEVDFNRWGFDRADAITEDAS
jgi:hypothetical protein